MSLRGDVKKIERESGVYTMWRDRPYVEMTEEEYRKLIGAERE